MKFFTQLENYKKIFICNKHSLIISSIILSGIIGYREFTYLPNFKDSTQCKFFFSFINNLLKTHMCKLDNKNLCGKRR
jgi:hypothetical protein